MKQDHRAATLAFGITTLFMFAALAIYGYLGTFTRYMADDYATASALRRYGFWGAQKFWWENWSGRFSFTFIVSFVELFGLKMVRVLPILVTGAWFIGIVWLCLPVLRNLGYRKNFLASFFIASVTLWMTYRLVDDYAQVVFWQTGILTYPISPILFLFGAGVVIRRLAKASAITWLERILWFLLAFVAGGFSETGVVVQATLIFVLFVIILISTRTVNGLAAQILIAALCGSLLALMVVAVAPGNFVRSDGFKGILPLGSALTGSLLETILFIPHLIRVHTWVLVLGLFAGIFLAHVLVPNDIDVGGLASLKGMGISLLIVFAGIWAGIVPAYFLRGALPPERSLLFSYFLVAGLVMYGGGLGMLYLRSKVAWLKTRLSQWLSFGAMLAFIAVGVIPFSGSQIQLALTLKEYAVKWDTRDQFLRTAARQGEKVVVVEDFMKVAAFRKLRSKLWLVGDFETDPNNWINISAAQYYGVTQIQVK